MIRRIWLDGSDVPRDEARHMTIRPWKALVEVVLDRDGPVYRASLEGRDAELSPGFGDVLDAYHDSVADYVWAWVPGGWPMQANGPTIVQLVAPFHLADRAAEGLRAAEMDGDFTGLKELTGELNAKVPMENWLAPGERQLRRGIDFGVAPSSFVKFLRARAGQWGLRLNGRAEPGAVWVRPTVSKTQQQMYAEYRDMHPMWVDPRPYVEHIEPDDAPIRPFLEEYVPRAANVEVDPVQFVGLPVAVHGRRDARINRGCPCGHRGGEDDPRHLQRHMNWSTGFPVPRNLMWPGDDLVAVVTETSPKAWRKLAYQAALLPRRENGYDFASFAVGDGVADPENHNSRAYLIALQGRVVGFCSVRDVHHSRWYSFEVERADVEPWEPESRPGDGKVRPVADVVWTADTWRRQGLAQQLVHAIAADNVVTVDEVAWSTPFSPGGEALARSLSPAGAWLA